MARRLLLSTLAVSAIVLCFKPLAAEAQYRNRAFGFYAGVGFNVPNNNLTWFQENTNFVNGAVINGMPAPAPADNPFSLINPGLHIEFLQKVSLESWFLKMGLNFQLTPTMIQDPNVPKALGGSVLWIEGSFAPRVYFLTDNIRPFAEFGVRLTGAIYTTAVNDIMPTNFKIMPGVYAGLGLEIIVARDIGISFMGKYTRWLIINYPGMNLIEALAGVIFYI